MNNMAAHFSLRQKIGLYSGLPLFIIILLLPKPAALSPEAYKVLAVAFLMAFWWITEAIPIPATALVPIAAFPLLGIMPVKKLASSYGHHYIFLFMGGFFIARAMQKWNLHERIALFIISLAGISPKRLIWGLMCATAFLSMWISDTATTMMIMPIGLAIILHAEKMFKKENNPEMKWDVNFPTATMLSIAYASLIGGIATLVGTPPNIVFASNIQILFPNAPDIGFMQWMMVGLPLTIIFLPITWYFITHIALPIKLTELPGGKEVIHDQIKKLGKMSKGEKWTLAIFIFTALGWIFRKNINIGFATIPGWSNLLGVEKMVHDSTVAILSALLLFSIPVDIKKKEFVLDWHWAKDISWGILILFGGGIALAKGVQTTGLAKWVGEGISAVSNFPVIMIILSVCLLMTFMTEITSNTAVSTIFMPILAATAVAASINPLLLMAPAAISASCAFMLPVATPPNAIVFSTGHITMPQMAKTGIGLNFLGAFLITLIIYFLAIPIFGIVLGELPIWAVQ